MLFATSLARFGSPHSWMSETLLLRIYPILSAVPLVPSPEQGRDPRATHARKRSIPLDHRKEIHLRRERPESSDEDCPAPADRRPSPPTWPCYSHPRVAGWRYE